MKFRWKQGTAILLTGVMTFSTISTPLASNIRQDLPKTTAFSTIIAESNENISEETAKKIAEEIISESYNYDGLDIEEQSTLSSGVKTVLKFIKNNWPKISKILKKYGVVSAKGKSVTTFINQLLSGVVSVDNSINGAIYAVVNFVAPGLSKSTKKIITNAIRLASPL